MYALYTNGNLRVGNVAPDYTFDNVTINQRYDNQDASQLNPAVQNVFFMIEDDTLDVNKYANGTSLLTAMYIDAQTYLSDDKASPVLFGGGGTAWNLCVWEGCPGYEQASITCAYGMSTAFRKLVPYFDDDFNLVHLHMIWIQSNNLDLVDGLPGDEGAVEVFSAMLTKIGEVPGVASPAPEADDP